MSDEQHPSDETISFEYSADGGAAEEDEELQVGWEMGVIHFGEPEPCRECGGTGSIALLVSAHPCDACHGSGLVWPEPRHERTSAPLGYWRSETSFDQQGRLVRKTLWFEPAEDAT